ncbi:MULTISPECIES: hypothetical protein [Pacificibacter]|uniref:hypothetical protein n=1 Tax=Pacificibacter TaxID=1042323 RepID=UPI001C097D30|nr:MULTISPECIES: hypothetical protein [Pacificibacter]MBU2935077.1 hypothetical protein [Pacificibacter marinus]MDO6615867.1 hypothetical protein [Pacificibacter sp. 1_MG-2023]
MNTYLHQAAHNYQVALGTVANMVQLETKYLTTNYLSIYARTAAKKSPVDFSRGDSISNNLRFGPHLETSGHVDEVAFFGGT